MQTIVVANRKGGVAKTTTALTISHALAQEGLRVLLVDADSQANASGHAGFKRAGAAPAHSLSDLLVDEGGAAVEGVAVQTPWGVDMVGADTQRLLASERELSQAVGGDRWLAGRLREGDGRWDLCVIDTGPSSDLVTRSALVAADEVIVPVQLEPYSAIEGLRQTLGLLGAVRRHLNPELRVSVVPTLRERNNVHAELEERVRAHVEELEDVDMAPVVIPKRTAVRRAYAAHTTVIESEPRDDAAQAYRKLARWLAERAGCGVHA
jgi:chromosome partitioning protein